MIRDVIRRCRWWLVFLGLVCWYGAFNINGANIRSQGQQEVGITTLEFPHKTWLYRVEKGGHNRLFAVDGFMDLPRIKRDSIIKSFKYKNKYEEFY